MKSVLLLLSALVAAAAIYEDQLGEADWKVENVGVIQHAIFQVRFKLIKSQAALFITLCAA